MSEQRLHTGISDGRTVGATDGSLLDRVGPSARSLARQAAAVRARLEAGPVEDARDAPVAELSICADVTTTNRTDPSVTELLLDARVGHTFLRLNMLSPARLPENTEPSTREQVASSPDYSTQLGFWPGAGKINFLTTFGPGEVREPDDAHPAKARVSYMVNREQLAGMLDYVRHKRSAQYSLLFYNCTTFASEAIKAAGKTPPASELFGPVCAPNAL